VAVDLAGAAACAAQTAEREQRHHHRRQRRVVDPVAKAEVQAASLQQVLTRRPGSQRSEHRLQRWMRSAIGWAAKF
jgi:hypothetical protein